MIVTGEAEKMQYLKIYGFYWATVYDATPPSNVRYFIVAYYCHGDDEIAYFIVCWKKLENY